MGHNKTNKGTYVMVISTQLFCHIREMKVFVFKSAGLMLVTLLCFPSILLFLSPKEINNTGKDRSGAQYISTGNA